MPSAKGRGRLELKCVSEETFFLVLKSFGKMVVGVLQGGAKGPLRAPMASSPGSAVAAFVCFNQVIHYRDSLKTP